jgi:hypothetical protein
VTVKCTGAIKHQGSQSSSETGALAATWSTDRGSRHEEWR